MLETGDPTLSERLDWKPPEVLSNLNYSVMPWYKYHVIKIHTGLFIFSGLIKKKKTQKKNHQPQNPQLLCCRKVQNWVAAKKDLATFICTGNASNLSTLLWNYFHLGIWKFPTPHLFHFIIPFMLTSISKFTLAPSMVSYLFPHEFLFEKSKDTERRDKYY